MPAKIIFVVFMIVANWIILAFLTATLSEELMTATRCDTLPSTRFSLAQSYSNLTATAWPCSNHARSVHLP